MKIHTNMSSNILRPKQKETRQKKKRKSNRPPPSLPLTLDNYVDNITHLLKKERGHNNLYCIMDNHDQHKTNELIFMPIPRYGRDFSCKNPYHEILCLLGVFLLWKTC